MEKLPKYRIYPSLLDKYQSLLDYEQEADAPWNKWSETSIAKAKAEYENRVSMGEFLPVWCSPEPGDYILSPDEMYDKIEQELIDSINRVEGEPSEAADKGTALNEIIDCMVMNKPCDRDDMSIESLRYDGIPYAIKAEIDGFAFQFDIELCKELKNLVKGGVCQYFVSSEIETRFGKAILYGYLDYWVHDHIIDLKTTSYYNFGKYERKWQRWVYPYCCIEGGLTDKISDFTYLVAQLGKGEIIRGQIYPETYTYNHEKCKDRLKQHVEGFIEWLEEHRYLIQDKKIFNNI